MHALENDEYYEEGAVTMSKSKTSFMSGVPELLVLRLLSRREMYGYELVRSIKEATNDSIVLAEGVVYPALHVLEYNGFLQSRKLMKNGRCRVYYKTTKEGEKRLRSLIDDWDRVSDGVTSVLESRHG